MNDKEARYLRIQKERLVRRRGTLWRRSFSAYIVIFGILAVLTIWAEGKNPKFILAFWAILGAVICVPGGIQEWMRLSARIADYNHALAAGLCEELEIAARRMWEFEEREDEGACYAFELAAGGVIFICGQDFYSNARFPNTDFSIVEIRDRKQKVLDMIVERRGEKMLPERRVSAKEKESIAIPKHRTFFSGSLEEVCNILRSAY